MNSMFIRNELAISNGCESRCGAFLVNHLQDNDPIKNELEKNVSKISLNCSMTLLANYVLDSFATHRKRSHQK